MPKVVAIVPARGGSKGVPHKNKRLVAGKPLITYTLEAARGATKLDHIAVSTDDSDIAQIARDLDVDVVMRPAEIAADNSPVIDAVRHALESVERRLGIVAGAVALLQPTSPFRDPENIDAAIELFFQANAPVCSVCRCEDNHPARMYRLEQDRLVSLMPELASMRRQDLPPVFHRNGSIYVFGPREIETGRIISENMAPYIMGGTSMINVDTEIDLLLAETMMKQRQ